jgi:hypothetical protein
MTLAVSTQAPPVAALLIVQSSATATPDNDVANGALTVTLVDVDNTANGAAACYLKCYDHAAPTVGTTAPDVILKVPAGQRRVCCWPEGLAFTKLSVACVTAGGTAGTTSPAAAVPVRILGS